ncbi:MAG TPA: hypothetical protein VL219_07980 [Steroidobacteraceae bacterium]|nr:hypothetical protein [Steroidobacteraceae bacterium]
MRRFHLVSLVVSFAGAGLAQDTARSAGWVVIPVHEYSALRAKAHPAEREPDVPRVDATLTRVDYDLRLDGAVAAGQATLTVDVLKDGWVRVPIPAGLLVSAARAQGQPVSLVPAPARGGPLSALFSRRGRAALVLDIVLPSESSGAEQRVMAPGGGSGITQASLTVPEDMEVTVAGGVLAKTSPGKWVAHGSGDEGLTFTCRRKRVEPPRVELPLRMRGSLTQLFGLGEDGTTINAEVEIEIVQGTAKQVRIAVPDGVAINHVPGGTVAEWDLKAGELLVTFLEPIERSARFGIIGEAKLPRDGPIAVPLLRLLDVERESGAAAVEVIGAGEIKNAQPQGLEPADAADLGPMLSARQSPALSAFRVRAAGVAPALRIDVARYAQQAVLTANVEEARHRILLSRDGKALVQARFAVRNNQRNFLRIGLPAGATLWSASVSGKPVRPGKASDGSLLAPLVKARAGEEAPLFAVEVVYFTSASPWQDKGRAALPLPALDLQVSRTTVTVHYPPMYRLTPETGVFRVQQFESPGLPILADDAAPAAAPSRPRAAPSAAQTLADNYRPRLASRSTTLLPKGLPFPAVGPSLSLAAELTEENKAPSVEVSYQKGGAQ